MTERSSGVLLAISSLPSRYGIGTLGKAAYAFADFLKKAGQRYWQLLPIGPTGFGDSPYQSFSTFAGNPYFIDLELLAEEELLSTAELDAVDWGGDPARVDYGKLYDNRFRFLRQACENGWARDAAEIARFSGENPWLRDYALFMALKRHFHMLPWTEWPDADIRLHRPEAVARYEALLADDVRLFTYIQYVFFRQWDALRDYVHGLGIRLIGDLPIYVALDSADVWAEPEQFQLDAENRPTAVAGCPPDAFSEDGQLWGNPLYDWERMRQDGYGWWIRRFGGAARLFDAVRIDHFRGLESYWSVPCGAETAKEGQWVKGPGMAFVGVLTGWFSGMEIIAEDLGYLTPEVRQLLRDSGLPGMKVLEFAFDPREPSDYLPHNYDKNCVCYIGTHDNPPVRAWIREMDQETLALARQYLGTERSEDLLPALIRAGMGSVASLFVLQMQDLLGLGAESRMNTPATAEGNWQWRMLPGAATDTLAEKLRRTTALYGRLARPVE